MYDQREKALRDYQWAIQGAREEGREEGEAHGVLVGSIVAFQGIVGDPEATIGELKSLDSVVLSRMLSDLQDRVRSRGS